MKLTELAELEKHEKTYRVSFEKRERGMLIGDVIPEVCSNEPVLSLISARLIAQRIAKLDPRVYVNICVVDSQTFVPIDSQRLNPYPSEWRR